MGRRRKGELPRLRTHRGTRRAYLTDPATGKAVYLGRAGTRAAQEAYDAWIRDHISRKQAVASGSPPGAAVTISRLIADYVAFARGYYRKRGRHTSEVRGIELVLGELNEMYGTLAADDLRPSHLRNLRHVLIGRKLSRHYINTQIQRVRRMLRWGVEHELVNVATLDAVACVRGLARGRTAASEPRSITPVDLDIFERTLEHCTPAIATLARVHLLLGCRIEEIISIRGADIDRTRTPWKWVLYSWKTEHHEHQGAAVVYIGPRGRELLTPLVLKHGDGWLFPSRGRGRSAGKGPGHLTRDGYWQAIERACIKVGVPKWTPLQLRHKALTDVRERYGLEGAQAIGRHREIETTQVYAERSRTLAKRIAEEMG